MIKQEILERGQKAITSDDYDILDKYARDIKAKTILEIGSRYGTSSMVLGQVAKDNGGKIYCVDHHPKLEWKQNMSDAGLLSYAVQVRACSPWIDYSVLPELIDFFYIDGDHRTSNALADFHFFTPLVREGGLIAFHDTVTKLENCEFMVNRAINIILEERTNVEEIAVPQTDYGIRILRKIKDRDELT